VVLVAVVLGTLGAMAYARYDWRGRSLFQRALVLPIFFPQPVLGLALLLSFSAVGIAPSWKTAIVAHLVWIVPIVTLVISIRLFGYDPAQEEAAFDLGASRWQVAREVTLPVLWPGIFSGALFAFLLSWSNLPLSAYTSGADTPLPVWLFTRTATNYSPLVPAVAVIGTVVSALIVSPSGGVQPNGGAARSAGGIGTRNPPRAPCISIRRSAMRQPSCARTSRSWYSPKISASVPSAASCQAWTALSARAVSPSTQTRTLAR
jgi:ABC-type spermidine/putrescine transport system permease subunit II